MHAPADSPTWPPRARAALGRSALVWLGEDPRSAVALWFGYRDPGLWVVGGPLDQDLPAMAATMVLLVIDPQAGGREHLIAVPVRPHLLEPEQEPQGWQQAVEALGTARQGAPVLPNEMQAHWAQHGNVWRLEPQSAADPAADLDLAEVSLPQRPRPTPATTGTPRPRSPRWLALPR